MPQKNPLKAEQLMTTDVFTVNLQMTVRQAMKMITENRVSGAPVVDNNKRVVSVLSEGDVLKLTASFGMDVTISSCLSKLCKTEALVTAKRSDTFPDIYKLFLTKSIHRILVIDANGHLQGIISRSNVLRALVDISKTEEAKTEEKVEKAG